MDLHRLLDQPNKLPTIPKVAQQVIASFGSEDVSVAEIAAQIATDPALTAKLLRLANSAYFRVSRTIGTVDDALRMLGFVMVRNLVLGNSMAAAFKNTPGLDLALFWRYNLYTACTARWLAQAHDGNGDLAFTVGLMHGIGQLHLHSAAPEAVAPLDRQCPVLDAQRAVLERQALGFHYGDVTAALAGLWHLPEPLIDALRAVPDPLQDAALSEPAAWVHLGGWRARCEVLALDEATARATYPTEVARRLQVAAGWAPLLAQPGSQSMPDLHELTQGLEEMLG